MFPLRAIPTPTAGDQSPTCAPANSPVLGFPPPGTAAPRAGEVILTMGQKLALLAQVAEQEAKAS